MTTRLLVISVGGSPEPLVASLLKWKPARTIFVVSAESKNSIHDKIILEVQRGGWSDFDAGRIDFETITDAQDFSGIVSELRKLDERIICWKHDNPDSELIFDFTGGTKAMTAGLALTAAQWPCQISYVGGTERTKDGVGIVVSGKEQIFHSHNPWDSLGFHAVDQAVVLFNSGNFAAAAQLLERTRNRMTDGANKREFQAFAALCQFFESWERFQHKDALDKLDKLTESKNDLSALLGQHTAQSMQQWLVRNKDMLKQLTKPTTDVTKLLALTTDLLANAQRRIMEGRYDDAVARLYRAIEAFAQARLYSHGFTDTSKVPVDRVPEPLRSNWVVRANDGQLKLGLQDCYALLDELGDKAGKRFKEFELDQKENPLTARNQSILAHGYLPVAKSVADKLFETALELIELTASELVIFPQLTPQNIHTTKPIQP